MRRTPRLTPRDLRTHPPDPPRAAREDRERAVHETTLRDPYQWLRDPAYPDVTDERILDYLRRENDYFHAMIYLTRASLKPLQLYLREIIYSSLDPQGSTGTQQTGESFMFVSPISVRAATIIASTIPILLVYPFLQRFYIKGIVIGSVKQ